jgi:hypothetical protein
MATSVKVHVTDKAIITALNTPGGAVSEWRDHIGQEVKSHAQRNSPINDPLNAMHRGGEVGEYAGSWDWDRRGSSGHHVVARVLNYADHAIFVELGRSGSSKMQIFSWTAWDGDIRRIGGPAEVANYGGWTLGRHPRRLSKGELRYNERINRTLPKREGDRTGPRAGMHILSRALVAVMGSAGISGRVDM